MDMTKYSDRKYTDNIYLTLSGHQTYQNMLLCCVCPKGVPHLTIQMGKGVFSIPGFGGSCVPFLLDKLVSYWCCLYPHSIPTVSPLLHCGIHSMNSIYIYILYNYSPCRVFPCFLTFFGHAIWEMWGSHDHASGTPWPSKRVLALTAAIVCWVPMSLVIVGGCPKSGGVNLGMYIHLWVLVSN